MANRPATLRRFVKRAQATSRVARGLLSRDGVTLSQWHAPGGGPRFRGVLRTSLLGDLATVVGRDAIRTEQEAGGGWLFRRAVRQLVAEPTVAEVTFFDALEGAVPRPEGWLPLCTWVRATMPVAATFEEQLQTVRASRLRKSYRKWRSLGLEVRVTRDAGDIAHFHEAMFLPMIRARHAQDGHVIPLEVMQQKLTERGFLLQLVAAGRAVAGLALYRSDSAPGALFAWRNGLLDAGALPPERFSDLLLALDAAAMELACDEHDRVLDFGLVRARSDDPVCTHKRRMGCDLAVAEEASRFHVHVQPQAWFEVAAQTQPLFPFAGGFEVHFGLGQPGQAVPDGDVKALVKDALFPSLRRLSVHLAPGIKGTDDVRRLLADLERELECPLAVYS